MFRKLGVGRGSVFCVQT